MKRLLRAVCLVLCWTLLMAGMPGRASAEEAAPMVRVLLRRLQLTDRADLTLAGAYTVRVGGEDLMALPENAQVTVQIRSGALYLFYDGMSMRLGKSAEFRRNQSGSAMPGLALREKRQSLSRFADADGGERDARADSVAVGGGLPAGRRSV